MMSQQVIKYRTLEVQSSLPTENDLTDQVRKYGQVTSLKTANSKSRKTLDQISADQLSGTSPEHPRSNSVHRVLIVDNNHDCADSLGILLQIEGYDIEVCYDGPSALDKAAQFCPHTVLLDLGMPHMSGLEGRTATAQSTSGKERTADRNYRI